MDTEHDAPAADDERRIVELFAHRQTHYDAATVCRLAGATIERLEVALDERQVQPVMEDGELRFRWEDVANLALERWTPRQIARALERVGHPHALPPLNQVRSITIELPVYQIRLLHWLAEEKSAETGAPINASDILAYVFSTMATDLPELELRFPGFERAALFPKPYGVLHVVEERCLYCGGAVQGAEICVACTRRHVPSP